jgi:hypothetical protein
VTDAPGSERLLLFAIFASGLGILLTLPLLLRETPYTFTLFMFVGQPLLFLGFALFTIKVFRDLRSRKLL